jgi:hypothetical protein
VRPSPPSSSLGLPLSQQRALTALRQRKYQEQLLTKTDSQLQTLQELVNTIEFTQIQATVMHGLSIGNEVLKQLHAEMSLDKVEKLMDQTQEGVQYQRVCRSGTLSGKGGELSVLVQEIDEALMSKMSPEEEDAVQEELAELEKMSLVSTLRSAMPRLNRIFSQRYQTSPKKYPYIFLQRPLKIQSQQQRQFRKLRHKVHLCRSVIKPR